MYILPTFVKLAVKENEYNEKLQNQMKYTPID